MTFLRILKGNLDLEILARRERHFLCLHSLSVNISASLGDIVEIFCSVVQDSERRQISETRVPQTLPFVRQGAPKMEKKTKNSKIAKFDPCLLKLWNRKTFFPEASDAGSFPLRASHFLKNF